MMPSRYGQPTRARDVLRHISLVDPYRDPDPEFVDQVRRVLNTKGGCGRYARTYEQVAKRIGWRRGGAGDILAKALALLQD